MRKIKTHNLQSKSSISFFAVILLFISLVIADVNPILNNISLYFICPIIFLYLFQKHHRLIIKYKPLLYFFLLILWSSVTLISSSDIDLSVNEIKAIVGSFLLSFILVSFSFINYTYLFLFYALYVLKFLFYCYRAIQIEILDVASRFSTEDFNSNMFGYYGFLAIISSFFLWHHLPKFIKLNKRIRFLLFLLFLLIIILSLLFNFYTASRAGLAITILTSILLLSNHFLYPFSIKRIFLVIVILFISLSFNSLQNDFLENSVMKSRFLQTNVLEDTRTQLVIEAYNLSLQNLIFGVGPGNFKLYSQNGNFSHNTFLEILVNNGIVGLFIYLAILKNFFTQSMKLYRINKHYRKEALYFLIFFVTFFSYNFFYVFHTSIFLISFLFIILTHQTQLINISYKQNQKGNR